MKRDEKIKIFTTKITAGKYKGKRIEIPDIFTTRGSKNILRESLFDTLQFDIVDKNFVEVFAGSGSIGLEALSRGAKECYFIEHNKIAFRSLQRNAKELDSSRTHLFFGDSFEKFEILYQIIEKSNDKSYFYFDPPFSVRTGMDDIYNKTMQLIETIEPKVCQMVIIEHMSSLDMPNSISVFDKIKSKKFGRSTITYYVPKEQKCHA